MGLFDIFRRKKKSDAASSANEASNSSQAASSASESSQSVSAVPSEAVTSEVTSAASTGTVNNSSATSESASAPVANTASDTSDDQVETVANPTSTSAEEEAESQAASASSENVTSTPTSSASVAVAETKPTNSSSASEETAAEPAASESAADEAETAAKEEEETSAESQEERYDRGLEKSRTGFGARLNRFLANFRHVDEDFFDDLEDLMIESDVGYDMAMKLSDSLQEEVKLRNAKSKQDVSNVIIEKMVSLYEEAGNGENNQINYAKSGPTVIMFVGVNGAGKTTTIGKLAARYKRQGKKVLLAAADTFRAGAVEQLDVWAKRDGVDIVTGPENGDPAAVVFDGVKKAKDENYDILLVDTAGRLQNKVNLMNELAKMKRVLAREIPDAPHEVLLVLDATTGQNALNQAKLFKESTDVTGIVLTKLDGTARGGIVLAIRNELHLPVKLVGLGEHVDDLADFDASEFVYGLFKGLVNE